MKYVINNMLNNKFHASKYDSPLTLLANYFTATIIKKYGPEIKKDINKTKNLFMQSYSRIRQLFSQQPKIDPTTGKKDATSGIAALYYRAHKEGASLKDAAVFADKDDADPTFDKYGTSHNIDDIVNSTTDYITLNKQTTYPEAFISQINRLTHVSAKIINQIAIDIHSPKYHEYIVDLLTLILGRLNIREKSEICTSQFILDIKKKVISSKNNVESQRIVKVIDIFLTTLFQARGLNFNKYSTVQRIQIRTVLIQIIVFNLKRVICHHQLTQQVKFLQQLKTNDVV